MIVDYVSRGEKAESRMNKVLKLYREKFFSVALWSPGLAFAGVGVVRDDRAAPSQLDSAEVGRSHDGAALQIVVALTVGRELEEVTCCEIGAHAASGPRVQVRVVRVGVEGGLLQSRVRLAVVVISG